MTAAQTAASGNSLMKMFQHWRKKRQFLAELATLDPETREQVLRDLQIDEGCVEALADGAMNTENLTAMLERLQLREETLAKAQPDLVGDLRRNCAMCPDWRQCENEIAAGSVSYPSPVYCPNKETLADLAKKSEAAARAA